MPAGTISQYTATIGQYTGTTGQYTGSTGRRMGTTSAGTASAGSCVLTVGVVSQFPCTDLLRVFVGFLFEYLGKLVTQWLTGYWEGNRSA